MSLPIGLPQLRVHLEIGLWRYGWVWLLAVVLAGMAVVGQVWWLARAQQAQEMAQKNLTRALANNSTSHQSPVPVSSNTNGDQVLIRLTAVSYTESQVGMVLQLLNQVAKAKGLSLGQSEFQTSQEGHGGLRQVQVTLPLRANYPQLRQFVEAALRLLPGVSLDQILIKRDNVAQAQAEIRLKFSLWIDPLKSAAAAMPATEPSPFKGKQP